MAISTTGANVHDVKQLLPLVDQIPPVAGKVGHPRQRPESFMPTGPIIPIRIDRNCVDEESSPGLRVVAPPTAAAWESIAGWSNEPYPGYITFVAFG